ncbi:MAG TPA: minor capsid protein [Bacillaceae bacterium]
MSNYWRERELKHIQRMKKEDSKNARRLMAMYQRALDEIQHQIEAFYGRYADKEGITMAEARKRVEPLDIEKYAEKAKRYVKGAHSSNPFIRGMSFTKRANEEMRLYNVTMKINRLQLLKLNTELELIATVSEEEQFLSGELTKQARAEYKRQSGILGETLSYNEKNIKSIVNSSFLSATWSDRLWANQAALRAELDKLLTRGIVQGKNPKELARELRKTFDSSVANSERLLITEMARVQQDVFQDSLRQSGYEQYEFIAEPDACPICKALNGKVFNLEDAEVGVNAYPMHPRCRCSQAAHMSREEWDRKLKERGL